MANSGTGRPASRAAFRKASFESTRESISGGGRNGMAALMAGRSERSASASSKGSSQGKSSANEFASSPILPASSAATSAGPPLTRMQSCTNRLVTMAVP